MSVESLAKVRLHAVPGRGEPTAELTVGQTSDSNRMSGEHRAMAEGGVNHSMWSTDDAVIFVHHLTGRGRRAPYRPLSVSSASRHSLSLAPRAVKRPP